MASTKAFTGQVTVLTMLALTLAREKRTIDETQYLAIVRELGQIPGKMKEVLKLNDRIAELPKSSLTHTILSIWTRLQLSRSVGRRFEAERNLVHPCGRLSGRRNEAWAYCFDRCGNAGGGYCHTERIVRKRYMSNIQEIKARKGRVIAIVTKGDTVIGKIADICIELPETMECLGPLITTVPLQLLAYHIAVCKGMDVDRPRNLAKSVTVE